MTACLQEGEFKEVLAACLAQPAVHVIELPIDYAMSAQLQAGHPWAWPLLLFRAGAHAHMCRGCMPAECSL